MLGSGAAASGSLLYADGAGGAAYLNPVLFDSTLGVDTASIDTGANGVAAGFSVLQIFIIARTDDAGAVPSMSIVLNNDTGNNYDRWEQQANNVTVSGGGSLASARWLIDSHGSGGSANQPAVCNLLLPGYTQTTYNKVATGILAIPDATAGNQWIEQLSLNYRSTAAISRVKLQAEGAAKLKAGTRLLIVGL